MNIHIHVIYTSVPGKWAQLNQKPVGSYSWLWTRTRTHCHHDSIRPSHQVTGKWVWLSSSDLAFVLHYLIGHDLETLKMSENNKVARPQTLQPDVKQQSHTNDMHLWTLHWASLPELHIPWYHLLWVDHWTSQSP